MKKPIQLLLVFMISWNGLFGQLSVREVYDFDIGDVFQYDYEDHNSNRSYQLTVINKS